MSLRVVVWGTGNVGRPAIRAVVANPALTLAGVIVSDPAKVGRDAGELADLDALGVFATDDAEAVLEEGPDAVVYAASADFRPDEALADIERCLLAGADVVTPSIYPLYHPDTAPTALRNRIDDACAAGKASLLATGIDPGWGQDLLPLVLSGVCGEITEVRCQEIFNYASYHAPDAVRDLVGMGMPMDQTPPMLFPTVPTSVWGPMIHTLADGLGLIVEDIREVVEREPLTRTVEVPTMGTFDEGTQGAFRFEVQGIVRGEPKLIVEHITRIDDTCAPQWASPAPGRSGEHRVVISGRPTLHVTVSADDGSGNSAEGGNATAAGRLVHAIPAVCAAPTGLVSSLDLPPIYGRGLVV